jgi:hypothetical protein
MDQQFDEGPIAFWPRAAARISTGSERRTPLESTGGSLGKAKDEDPSFGFNRETWKT